MSIGASSHEPDTSGLIVSDVDQWVGTAEIMQMFGGISRQRAYQLTSRPDFPAPVVKLKGGSVWITAEVVAWAEARGREVHDD